MTTACRAACARWIPQSTFGRTLSLVVLLVFLFVGTTWNAIEETREMTEWIEFKSLDAVITDGIKDFPNRAKPIPRKKWAKLDNQTCLSQGEPQYPPEGSLQRRLSFAMVIGSMKSGTSALSSYLYQHPDVVKPVHKEMHFFDFEYETFASADGIHRSDARRRYRMASDHTLGNKAVSLLQGNRSLVAIDDSPRYMFWSDRVPARVLCVAPWAKLLAIVRNPIDRAYSQYNMKMNNRKQLNQMKQTPPTFEEWMAMDMHLLKETGVVQDKIPFKEFAGSAMEMKAWKKYTRKGKHAPLGRGLYSIQLRHWFQAYEAAGKNASDFFIIQSERMRSDKSGVYAELLEFLGLEQHELETEDEPNSFKYKAPLKNETREILEAFYKPYNQELYKLLGREWEGAWDR